MFGIMKKSIIMLPTLIFFGWTIYYILNLIGGGIIPGTSPMIMMSLGYITLIGARYALRCRDNLTFFLITCSTLIPIGFILFWRQICDVFITNLDSTTHVGLSDMEPFELYTRIVLIIIMSLALGKVIKDGRKQLGIDE